MENFSNKTPNALGQCPRQPRYRILKGRSMRLWLPEKHTTADAAGNMPRPRVPRPVSLVRMTICPAWSQGEIVQQYQCHQPEKAHRSFGKKVVSFVRLRTHPGSLGAIFMVDLIIDHTPRSSPATPTEGGAKNSICRQIAVTYEPMGHPPVIDRPAGRHGPDSVLATRPLPHGHCPIKRVGC